jgi:hypothetical protein
MGLHGERDEEEEFTKDLYLTSLQPLGDKTVFLNAAKKKQQTYRLWGPI